MMTYKPRINYSFNIVTTGECRHVSDYSLNKRMCSVNLISGGGNDLDDETHIVSDSNCARQNKTTLKNRKKENNADMFHNFTSL